MKTARALVPLATLQLLLAALGGCGVDSGDVDPDGVKDAPDDTGDAPAPAPAPADDITSLTPKGDLVHVPRVRGQAQADIDHARQGLQCLRAFMQNTYVAATARAQKICGLALEVDYADESVALYSASDPTDTLHPDKTRRVVLSFTGTHEPLDWIRNIQSQVLVTPFHANPMTGKYQYGMISAGWTDRWISQATKVRHHLTTPIGTIASRVKEHARLAKTTGEQLVVYVVGHSLGAAVSDVAGFDISEWLRVDEATLKQEVVVASFNMPRYGYSAARDAYKDKLLNDCTGPSAGRACITRWALTRDLDPVQSIPVALPLSTYDQILWQTSVTEAQRRQIEVGAFPFARTQTLSYCPQFHAPKVTGNASDAVKNHGYLQWEADVNTSLSTSHLLCMFSASK
jgi:Lipase (class 3)